MHIQPYDCPQCGWCGWRAYPDGARCANCRYFIPCEALLDESFREATKPRQLDLFVIEGEEE